MVVRSVGSRQVGWWERGQATVEYALVLLAFLSVALGLGAVWRAVRDGGLLDGAVGAASHTWSGGMLGALRDVALF